jgi:lanosterol synthase
MGYAAKKSSSCIAEMAIETGRNAGGAPKRPTVEAKTDHKRWRMKDDDSHLTWHYLTDAKAAEDWPQSYAEKYYLNLPLV